MRHSKTIETQTNEVEEQPGVVDNMTFDEIDISIPDTKSIKDG